MTFTGAFLVCRHLGFSYAITAAQSFTAVRCSLVSWARLMRTGLEQF